MNGSVESIKKSVEVLGEIIKVAGDNEDVKAAGCQLGKTALTVAKALNNALLPLAALNFAFDKAKQYFSTKFESEITEKTSTIPPELLIEPKATVAGPALQGLAFAHDEAPLKEMYLSLIASAMDERIAEGVHPAFVEIIRQLSGAEAKLLARLLSNPRVAPLVELRLVRVSNGNWISVYRHLLDTRLWKSDKPTENPFIETYVDNWVRLGLVEVDYTREVAGESAYSWVDDRPEVLRLKQEMENSENVIEIERGGLVRTAFGKQFAQVVGIREG